ncbi:MAG TPA: hypothetical protein VFZ83_13780 [Acidimicrobiia bacterium]|nr:hypothetical protein [Acidimicrobiia bacterium]
MRRHEPQLDRGSVGTDFVDVLLALVVIEILRPLRDYQDLSVAAWSHLGLAAVLTVTTWIGHHRRGRQQFLVRFFNLPLWSFGLDLLMVAACWMVAVTAESEDTLRAGMATVRPEAIFVMGAFALYSLRDLVTRRMRTEGLRYEAVLAAELPGYEPAPTGERERRTMVTEIFAGLAFVVGIAALVTQASVTHVETWHAVLFDGLLAAVLIGFRVATDYVSGNERDDVIPTRSFPGAST